ncbi:MAG: hypothetical protein SFU56_12110 [Capsulimonadales bacterium]|nr:hypothetical protein [Capsulimonadales bacterium]
MLMAISKESALLLGTNRIGSPVQTDDLRSISSLNSQEVSGFIAQAEENRTHFLLSDAVGVIISAPFDIRSANFPILHNQ